MSCQLQSLGSKSKEKALSEMQRFTEGFSISYECMIGFPTLSVIEFCGLVSRLASEIYTEATEDSLVLR